MKDESDAVPMPPSNLTLFRYLLVSQVLSLEQQGVKRAQAISTIAEQSHQSSDGTIRSTSSSSLRRWLNAFEANGFSALRPALRKQKSISRVIPPDLLDFFKQQKNDDPLTSIPELIRRAKELDLIESMEEVDRSTLWRCLKRMKVNTRRSKSASGFRDKRRFVYPHRMDMVLCDGKHFRAGAARLRRVALFFLDDATRLILAVVVGTSENTELFLRGVYECFSNFGAMSALYVDHGSGFTSMDSVTVLQQLKTLFIHGEAGYPQARGKIERFNQTALASCIRHLDGNLEVDPNPAALELRLRHFVSQQYNQTPHESLKLKTPWERFVKDLRPLRFKESTKVLKRAFVIHHNRRVSNDNVVSFKGVIYEMPTGYEGQSVMLRHLILEGTLCFIHLGKEITLSPPDTHANALSKRARPKTLEPQRPGTRLPKSSAQIAFDRDHRPIVDSEGGFLEPQPKNKPKF